MYEYMGSYGTGGVKLRNTDTGEIRLCPGGMWPPDEAWAEGQTSVISNGDLSAVWVTEEATGKVICKFYRNDHEHRQASVDVPVALVGDIPGYVRDPASDPVLEWWK